jgi:calcineurin-like phosphoesterase family protein
MDETLVKNWNEVVKGGDRVFFLGDVSICRDLDRVDRLLARLAGQKFWILGNHDHEDEREKYAHHFQKMERLMDLRIGKGEAAQDIVLCHYAMLVWNKSHYGSWMLHGHSHGELKYPFQAKIMDVGVDAWNYRPVSFEMLKEKLDKQPVGKHHDL